MEIDLEVALAALAAAEAACVELEDTPERERERAAEAHGHAEAGGKDPSTERQIKYVAGKFSTWLSLHGEAHGYGDGDEPSGRPGQTVPVALFCEQDIQVQRARKQRDG